MDHNRYHYFVELLDRASAAHDSHICADDQSGVDVCEVCEAANDAEFKLQQYAAEIVGLLKRYHDCLQEFSQAVTYEVPQPRPAPVQLALLKALALLEREK